MPAFGPGMSFADPILNRDSDISTGVDMVRIEKFSPNAQKSLR
jgi:chromosome partitioning protein